MRLLYAQASEPAGGAAIGEVVLATGGALVATTVLMALCLGHRSGRIPVLERLAGFSERVGGLPGWAALPLGVATGSLLIALFGMLWDISLHIDVGRDEGPLANPAHYFILIGLFGIFAAGVIGMALPKERPSETAVRIAPDWHAPLGAVVVAACGGFALAGFPLDDVWHRLFGQDVTLWGPTHLMLIGGAAMTLIGLGILTVEALRANEGAPREESTFARRARLIALPGGLLLGMSVFQAEFDFGVPQFRFVFHPLLIMVAAAVTLVAVRIWLGRGAALGAALFFLAVRGLFALIVGPVLGESTPHFPLYVVEAAIVELVALRVPTDRPLRFAAVAGVLMGTVGLAAEWAWSQLMMPIPWPSELLPEGALLGFAGAVTAALVGGWAGARLAGERPGTGPLRAAAIVGAAGLTALVGYGLYKPANEGVTARVALEEVRGGPGREVNATIRLDPPDAADDAEWLMVTAWQGDGLVVEELESAGEGTYRTAEPIPVHGNWKTLIRLHDGDSLTALPIFLPEDTAIPAREVPAEPSFTRAFVADHEILQREQKSAAGWLTGAAYGVVIAITLGLLVLTVWSLHRLSGVSPGFGDGRSAGREGGRRTASGPAPVTG